MYYDQYSSRTVDPYADVNGRRSRSQISLSDIDPYRTPKIVELDANNNVILPEGSRSKKRSKSRDLVLQEVPSNMLPFNNNNNNTIQQQNYPNQQQQQYYQNQQPIYPNQQPIYPNPPQNYNDLYSVQQPPSYPPAQNFPQTQPNTFIVQDQNGKEITRIISSQVPNQPVQSNLLLQPSYVIPAAPIVLQQPIVTDSTLSRPNTKRPFEKINTAMYKNRKMPTENLTLINEEKLNPTDMIYIGRYQRKRSDYVFCCAFCGHANTDTCDFCWKWCGCPTWFTVLLALIYVLVIIGLIVIVVLFKLSVIS